ncbi:hypothetical protein AVEN_173099-1 [Araneus ventricosus]|uniref:Uncharacterized protein n=1 Tax=Araneus ventricosus TaxID=182803 RepID=A0A4Y2HMY6_ARAVE|nr:hypothetical protein AVEN_129825-1 [Araneus ventricosus]GBM66746.1 hypothetical protein AVEN_173099-1 [Araneus ventricosus]
MLCYEKKSKETQGDTQLLHRKHAGQIILNWSKQGRKAYPSYHTPLVKPEIQSSSPMGTLKYKQSPKKPELKLLYLQPEKNKNKSSWNHIPTDA